MQIQIITQNNQDIIEKTLKSVQKFEVVICDLGSTDETLKICKGYKIVHSQEKDFSLIRKSLSSSDWNLYLYPGETLVQGSQHNPYVSVVSHGIIYQEPRIWKGIGNFKNPVFEKLEISNNKKSDIVVLSNIEHSVNLPKIQQWKEQFPVLADPYYYEACCYLSLGKIEEFKKSSESYMFWNKSISMTSIMNCYYYALVHLHEKNAKVVMQNLAICLSENPTMAEFWCLAGDVYYYLLDNFVTAKSLYENAILMGQRRKSNSLWSMDISKYREYPEKMIKSCNTIQQAILEQ